MARKKNWRRIAKKFVARLQEEIPVDRAIVFGSYARGTPKVYSDLDIAIFSSAFRHNREIEDMQYLFKVAQDVDTLIEPYPFLPKEIKHVTAGSLLEKILQTGKTIV